MIFSLKFPYFSFIIYKFLLIFIRQQYSIAVSYFFRFFNFHYPWISYCGQTNHKSFFYFQISMTESESESLKQNKKTSSQGKNCIKCLLQNSLSNLFVYFFCFTASKKTLQLPIDQVHNMFIWCLCVDNLFVCFKSFPLSFCVCVCLIKVLVSVFFISVITIFSNIRIFV